MWIHPVHDKVKTRPVGLSKQTHSTRAQVFFPGGVCLSASLSQWTPREKLPIKSIYMWPECAYWKYTLKQVLSLVQRMSLWCKGMNGGYLRWHKCITTRGKCENDSCWANILSSLQNFLKKALIFFGLFILRVRVFFMNGKMTLRY